jgi:hypothetical protein
MSDRPSILGPLVPKDQPSKSDVKQGCVAIICFLLVVAIFAVGAYWTYLRLYTVFFE